MTRDEAIKLILQRAGRRENDQFLQEVAVLEMKIVQETTLEQADFKPWFLLSEFMRARTGANEPRMPLPTNFLEEHEEGLLWVLPIGATKYVPLRGDTIDTLEERYNDKISGQPEAYGVAKNYFILFPSPDAEYPLKMRCYLKEPTFSEPYGSGDQTNAWLTHAADWLVGEVGKKIASFYLKDEATAQKFAEEGQAAKQRLYVQHVAREEMNRQRSAGDD